MVSLNGTTNGAATVNARIAQHRDEQHTAPVAERNLPGAPASMMSFASASSCPNDSHVAIAAAQAIASDFVSTGRSITATDDDSVRSHHPAADAQR